MGKIEKMSLYFIMQKQFKTGLHILAIFCCFITSKLVSAIIIMIIVGRCSVVMVTGTSTLAAAIITTTTSIHSNLTVVI